MRTSGTGSRLLAQSKPGTGMAGLPTGRDGDPSSADRGGALVLVSGRRASDFDRSETLGIVRGPSFSGVPAAAGSGRSRCRSPGSGTLERHMDGITPGRAVSAFHPSPAAGGGRWDQVVQRLTAGRGVPRALDGQRNSHSAQLLVPIIALLFPQ